MKMFYNNYMALLEIKKYPEMILREKTAEITDLDAATQNLINNMIDTMHFARGIGLAANQVGVSRRLCVIDLSMKDSDMPLLVLVNPIISAKEGLIEGEEGCLSIPGYMTKLKRAEKIFVKAFDREGKDFEIEADGILARVLQHEIDHLDGFLFIDRMSPIRREFFKRRYRKFQQEKK